MTTHSTQDYQGVRLHDMGHQSPATPVNANLQKPLIVGIWRLVRRLHAGAWCEVYAAQPADAAGSPRFDYAVKLARATDVDRAEVVRQIRSEIEVARAARHPHLVPVIDADLYGTRPFIVMPRLEARSLAEIISKSDATKKPQPVPVALWWIRQAAQALQAIHHGGWIHGDIKPENIVIDSKGHVTLIDLGFAQPIGAPADQCFRGTPDYAAPEQLAGSSANPKSDIYALGRVLAKLLADRQACPSAVLELAAIMQSIAADERPSSKDLVERLLELEIETLHLHLGPDTLFPKKVA